MRCAYGGITGPKILRRLRGYTDLVGPLNWQEDWPGRPGQSGPSTPRPGKASAGTTILGTRRVRAPPSPSAHAHTGDLRGRRRAPIALSPADRDDCSIAARPDPPT